MNSMTSPNALRFAVQAAFSSGGEAFADQSFVVIVDEGEDPSSVARLHAYESSYADVRVPDLTIAIRLQVEGNTEP